MFKGAKAPNKFKRSAGKTILRAFRRAKVRRLFKAARPARIRANFIRSNPQLYMGRHTLPTVGDAYRQSGIRLNRQRPSYKRYTGNSSIGYFNKRY